MAIVNVPGQNLSYWVPDDGQIYKNSAGDLNYRTGSTVNQVYSNDLKATGMDADAYLKSIGINPSTVTTISDSQLADFNGYTSRGQTGLTLANGGLAGLAGLTQKTGEVTTFGPGATNPHAASIVSNQRGDLSPTAPKYAQEGAAAFSTRVNPNASGTAGNLGGYQTPVVNPEFQVKPGETTTQYNERMTKYYAGGATATGQSSISSSMLGGTTPLDFKTPAQLPGYSSTLGLNSNVPQITATGPENDLQKRMDNLMALTEQASGKEQYRNEQNAAQGVDEKSRLVNDFSSQLKVVQLEAANIQQTTQQGQGVTTAIDQRQRAEALRLNNVKSLGIYAQLEMAKGNLATARDAVERAIELKYGPIEAQIKAARENIEILRNSPSFDIADKNRTLQVEAQLDAREATIAQQKENEKRVWDVYAQAVENGLTDVTTLNAIKSAASPQEALQIAAQAGVAGSPQKTITSGALQYTQSDIDEGYNILKTGKHSSGQSFGNPMGADGFVDPRAYLGMLDQWRQNGGQVDDFLKTYPLTLINPTNTWIGAELQSRAVAWKPQGTATGSFTDVEIRKLEQAGLQNATRQQQLDHLYGATDDLFDSF